MKLLSGPWAGRRGAILILVASLVIYALSLVPGVFPGSSSAWVGYCLQIDRLPHTNHLLWRALGALALQLPIGDIPLRLNVLAAVCGASAVALLFALERALLLMLCFRDSPVPARYRKRAAFLAGFAAALALGAAAPFWIAATRFLPQAFDILLILGIAWLLVRAAIRSDSLPLGAAAFLLGMLIFESESGLRVAPLLLVGAVGAMRMGRLLDTRGYAALVGMLAVGVVAYLGLAWVAGQLDWSSRAITLVTPLRGFVSSLKMQYALVVHGWRADPRVLTVLCFSLIPWLAAAALALWNIGGNARTSGGFLNLVVAGAVAIGLSGVTISPWGAYRAFSQYELPCTVYLLCAMVAGYLVGYGALLAGGRLWFPARRRPRRQADDDDPGSSASRANDPDADTGRLLVLVLLVFLVAVGFTNATEVRAWRDVFADRFARELLAHMESRTWLISENPLNSHLRVHARLSGTPLVILPAHNSRASETICRRLRGIVDRDATFADFDTAPLRASLNTNVVAFIQTWMRTDPSVGAKLATFDGSSLWADAGLDSAPIGILNVAIPTGTEPDLEALVKDFNETCSWVEPWPLRSGRTPAWLHEQRLSVRRQVYDNGLRLAKLLASRGRSRDAERILQRTRGLMTDVADTSVRALDPATL